MGLALGTVRYPIVLAVTLFGLMSFVMSLIGLKLGGKLGTVTGERGEVVAGIMLVGLSGVIQETLYLFSTRANAVHILRGLAEARDGTAEPADLEALAARFGAQEQG